MRARLSLALSITALFGTAASYGQVALPETASPVTVGKAPAAYVYVSSATGNSSTTIQAYSAAEDGRLTQIQSAPFNGQIVSMAVNGKYLFGASAASDIYSFAMQPNGTIHVSANANVQSHAACYGGGPNALFLDHKGADLYDMYYNGPSCGDNTFQSFAVDKPTGNLNYLGSNFQSSWFIGPLSFIGNDKFAYSAVCDVFTSPPGPNSQIYGFERHADGMLTYVNISAPLPTPAPGFNYCPSLAAADPTNHVAISVTPYQEESLYTPRLATYTADQYGNLTTTSTRYNMARTDVLNMTDLKMSPSGKLLAVAGTDGLQVFHFNGSDPITHYSGLLTKTDVEQVFWDNSNHLYGISVFSNKLYVFTVTPTSIKQAPGSPYTIANPSSVIVQPKAPRP